LICLQRFQVATVVGCWRTNAGAVVTSCVGCERATVGAWQLHFARRRGAETRLAKIRSANALVVGSYAVSNFARRSGFGSAVTHLVAVADGAIGGGATQIGGRAIRAWCGYAVVAGRFFGLAAVGLAFVYAICSARQFAAGTELFSKLWITASNEQAS